MYLSGDEAIALVYSNIYLMEKIIEEITSINDRANLAKSSRWLYYLTSMAKYTDEDPYTNKSFAVYFADNDSTFGNRIIVNACGFVIRLYYFDDKTKNYKNNDRILALAEKINKFVKTITIRYAVISYDNTFRMLNCHLELHKQLVAIYKNAEVISLVNTEGVSNILEQFCGLSPKTICFHSDNYNFHSISGSLLENSQSLGSIITPRLETLVWSENLYRLTGVFSKFLALRSENFKLKKLVFNLVKMPNRENEPTLQLTVLNMIFHITDSLSFSFMPSDLVHICPTLFPAKKFEELIIKVDCLDDFNSLSTILHHLLASFLHRTETFKLFINEKVIKQIILFETTPNFGLFLELCLWQCVNLSELNLSGIIKKKFRFNGEQLMRLIYVFPDTLKRLTLKGCDSLTLPHLKVIAHQCPLLEMVNFSKLTHDSMVLSEIFKSLPNLRYFSLEEANCTVRQSFLEYLERLSTLSGREKEANFDVLIFSGQGTGILRQLENLLKDFPRPMNYIRILTHRDDVDYEVVISTKESNFDVMYNNEFIHFGQCKYCKYFENYTFET